MIKWIYIFFFTFYAFSNLSIAKEIDYSVVANKNYDSKYHFFYSKELKSNLLAFQKKDSTIALYQYMSDRKWKPISNAKAYDGFPKAENIFPDMRYDKRTGTVTMGKIVKIKSPLTMNKDNNYDNKNYDDKNYNYNNYNNKTKVSNSTLVIKTTQGDIGLELFDSLTPKTADNFLFLAKNKLYDGLIFHRVIDNFMIQGGDPSGDGTGSMSKWGAKFEDEFVDDLEFDKPYLLAMANSGPNTNGSQFFITLNAKQTQHLTGKHTIFGRVVYGFKVVDKIAKVKTNGSDTPIVKQEIISIRVTK